MDDGAPVTQTGGRPERDKETNDMQAVLDGILRDTLSLAADFELTAETPLLGAVPELDSMAVVVILTTLEEELGIAIDDDEVDAEIFETYGNLLTFVQGKT